MIAARVLARFEGGFAGKRWTAVSPQTFGRHEVLYKLFTLALNTRAAPSPGAANGEMNEQTGDEA